MIIRFHYIQGIRRESGPKEPIPSKVNSRGNASLQSAYELQCRIKVQFDCQIIQCKRSISSDLLPYVKSSHMRMQNTIRRGMEL